MEYKVVTDDPRGVFAELLKLDCGQVSYLEVAPNVKRGGHYHKRKSEVFILLTGDCALKLINGDDFRVRQMEKYKRYVIPVNTYHTLISNSGKKAGILVFCDEVYNPEDEDTYSE